MDFNAVQLLQIIEFRSILPRKGGDFVLDLDAIGLQHRLHNICRSLRAVTSPCRLKSNFPFIV
jgi:hypothetical protein